MGCHHKTDL